jgi:Na+:H+ antiporter, NhaA family
MVVRKHIIHPIKELAENGKLTGIMLITATFVSLILSNSDYGISYLKIWNTEIGSPFLHKSILHWINDGFMAVFFLLAGLEIKRELLRGELSTRKTAILPVAAAFGGILLPAIIFSLLNVRNPGNMHGWAIPTATDIAFSLGILSLLGNRVPFALKIFLTALAIIDDLAAILIIALFYTHELHFDMIIFAALVFIILIIMNKMKIKQLYFFFVPGVALWYFILESGIHPTVAGVLLAFTIPVNLIEELEHRLNKPVNYFILPLFALANTAMPVSLDQTGNLLSPLSLGIIFGLVIGKPAGIALASLLAVRLKFASLPAGIKWKQIIGLGMTAGIGFTMSIFIASLSFEAESTLTLAKLSILAGSFVSAVAGILLLRFTSTKDKTLDISE